MNAQDSLLVHAIRLAKYSCFIGWVFLVGGFFLCLSNVPPLFDPRATIMVNGVPTNDFTAKLGVAAFVVMLPVVGAFFALMPKQKLQARWATY